MKILILGGSGGMGRFASRAISSIENISLITIADLNAQSVKEFADSFKSTKIIGIGLDVLDKEALKNKLSEHDVVLNLTGPFFKFAYPILEAALEENCHYLDICDDWEPTEKMFALNDLAQEKNKTAIIGLGASPGITNFLALKAMTELDEVNKIYTGWDISSAEPEEESSQSDVNAATLHGIEQMVGRVKVFKDNKFQMVRPLKRVDINYPEIGEFKVSIFGHPEAITFPHHYPEISESLNLMHGDDGSFRFIFKILRFFIEVKLLTKNTAARIIHWLETKNSKVSKDSVNSLPGVYGLAKGLKNGTKTSIAVTLDSSNDMLEKMSMGEATGYPLACGLKMLIDGKINKFGVLAPEACGIDPDIFFQELSSILGHEERLKTIVTARSF
tara:strand:+ start:99 stop:1265 length:1167 start_codon:yes stop_codon:yes gene_type:complete